MRVEIVNFKGHLSGGILGFLITLAIFRAFNQYVIDIIPLNYQSAIFYFLLFVYMSLFPDVDTDSKIENATYAVALVSILVLIFMQLDRYGAIIGMALCIPKISTHRKLMHNPLTGIALSGAVALMVGLEYGLFAWSGFMTHLILDKIV